MAVFDQPHPVPAGLKTAGNGVTVQAGTRLANIDTLQGCGLISPASGWGGARNRADRESSCLTLAQCEGLIAAACHAERLGLRFNRHWTIHYQQAGIAEADAARFIGKLRKLAQEYSRRNRGGFAAIWARESGEGKGGHVHILMHLPARLSLKGRTRRWVRLAGGKYQSGVSYIRAVAGRLSAAESGAEQYAVNAEIVRHYLMKGAAGEVREALGLGRFPGEQGEIIGKRCGTTQNIGPGARSGQFLDT
jgi:hypothetical protein